MKWHYRCPICKHWRSIDWTRISSKFKCHKDESKKYYPPRPKDQHDAYVDDHNWPEEMEKTVIALKGNKCTVPDCKKKFETLDHHVAWSKGGKTSVANLFPICNKHNQSKGDKDYEEWLFEEEFNDD